MIEYVVGFGIDREKEVVLLCRKHKPQWQAGLLNGLGGKIEAGETPMSAMIREWDEEGNPEGIEPVSPEWTLFCRLWVPDKTVLVWCFEATLSGAHQFDRHGHNTDVGDEITMVSFQELYRYPMVPNLRWLIPLALDRDRMNVPQIEMAAT